MKILVAGSSGFVGTALKVSLTGAGHEVMTLVRRETVESASIRWDPAAGAVPALDAFEFEAVVNLAGENVASGRWTAKRRDRLRQSRVLSTATLCNAFREMSHPPAVLINASAVGFYGDCGDQIVTEESPAGDDFLAALSEEWEGAANAAAAHGMRVAILRFGMVLGPAGGALSRMLPAFRLGFGGRLGSGSQYVSWIELSDAVTAICHIIEDERLQGPVNLVAPNPVTNAEFTRCLGTTLRRPTILPAPAWALRLVLGAMANELLLSSTRAVPQRLSETEFAFAHAHLDSALRSVLGSGNEGR